MYEYTTCCIHSTVELLEPMIESAVQVTWETFRSHVPWQDVQMLFPFYSYRGETLNPVTGEQTCGFHIKDDWAVRFWRSAYDGSPCYYITHSAIEYVFTEV